MIHINITECRSSDPFKEAIDKINTSGGGTLYLPTGNYNIAKKYRINNVPFSLIGDGMDVTIIGIRDEGGFEHVTRSPILSSSQWKNLTLEAVGGKTLGAAIKLIRTDADHDDGTGRRNCSDGHIDNVKIMSTLDANSKFEYGIHIDGARNVNITNCVINGNEHHMFGTGIRIEKFFGQNTRIVNCMIRFWDHGIDLIDGPEGTHIDHCEFVPVNIGVYSNNNNVLNPNGNGKPHVIFANSHVNAYKHGIYSEVGSQWFIHDNLFYLHAREPDTTGIYLRRCNGAFIHHNIHFDTAPAHKKYTDFVNVDNSFKIQLDNNQVWSANNGIVFGRNTRESSYNNNTILNISGIDIIDKTKFLGIF